MVDIHRTRIQMQKLNLSTADRERDLKIIWMNSKEELKVEIERWQADIKVHRSGFLLSDTKRGFGAAFMKEVDAAQQALNALVKAMKGNGCKCSTHVNLLTI